MPVEHASRNNLQNISVNIPRGVLTVVTGVVGAGESTLLEVFLSDYPDSVMVDQSPIRTSTRSIPATYTGIMDEVRDMFARAN